MYAQVEKSRESKSKASANSIIPENNKGNQGFGIVDNRSEVIAQKKIQERVFSSVNPISQLQKNSSSSTVVIQRQISDGDYNWARATLVAAGSATAAASHVKHTHGAGSPDGHGQSLLREARDEFRGTDHGLPGLRSGMTVAHHTAIHAAADRMGIDRW